MAVARLAAFERFVLVMTVLENYSVQECSVLVGRPAAEVMTAKSQALRGLGSPSAAPAAAPSGAAAWAAFLAPTELA
jgi:hypothetical protein